MIRRLLLLAWLTAAAAAGEAARIEPVAFLGHACLRLANDNLEAVVAPAINRIVSLRRHGRPNLLWMGQERAKYPTWVNYGGSKLWPAPQSAWREPFPPLPALDQEAGAAEVADGAVLLRTPACAAYGIRFERRIALDGDTLAIEERLVNVADHPVRWALWEVTQARLGGVVLIPGLADAAAAEVAHHPLRDARLVDGVLRIAARPDQPYSKVTNRSPSGILAYMLDDQVLIRRGPAMPPGTPDAAWPDGHRNVEVFIGNGYIELEAVGPQVELAPGAIHTWRQTWTVVDLRIPAPEAP